MTDQNPKPTVIEQTSKRIKTHKIVAGSIMIAGITFMFLDSGGFIGSVIVMFGLLLMIGANIRAWWNHG